MGEGGLGEAGGRGPQRRGGKARGRGVCECGGVVPEALSPAEGWSRTACSYCTTVPNAHCRLVLHARSAGMYFIPVLQACHNPPPPTPETPTATISGMVTSSGRPVTYTLVLTLRSVHTCGWGGAFCPLNPRPPFFPPPTPAAPPPPSSPSPGAGGGCPPSDDRPAAAATSPSPPPPLRSTPAGAAAAAVAEADAAASSGSPSPASPASPAAAAAPAR